MPGKTNGKRKRLSVGVKLLHEMVHWATIRRIDFPSEDGEQFEKVMDWSSMNAASDRLPRRHRQSGRLPFNH